MIHCASLRCGRLRVCAGDGQDRRARGALRLALRFHLAEQHGRSDGADGNGARLRAALAVEDFALVAGGENALHGGERRADDADAAHQLVGTAIDVDAPHDQRNDLEGLRRAALRDGEAGRDVFKVEAVGLALLLGFVDQLLAQTRTRERFGRRHNQVALAAGGHVAGFSAAVAVGSAEAGDGQARHEKGFEHAVLDQIDALGFLALVVVLIAAAEPDVAEVGDGGVVGDGKEVGQHRLADVLGKGLALFVAALALALEAVAEHFVEEHGGGAAGENRRTVERLSDRRLAQRFKTLAELAHGRFELGLRGKAVDGFGLECLLAEEIHAVVGAGYGDERRAARADEA